MLKNTKDSISWLTFDVFSEFPRLIHGIFLRHGGVSRGPFTSLNFAIKEGESFENVTINRQRAMQVLGISQFCGLSQEHGKRVVPSYSGQLERGDALTTQQPYLGLMILHADCQAAIFYDPIHHAVANVHCGWRGNVQNIYKETLERMYFLYGSRAEDVFVGISPSLGPNAAEFINFKTEFPPTFYPFQSKPAFFDLWEISRSQLIECGILPHHLEIARICTYSNPDDFFSYRHTKISGRHATIAALR